jgi:DNA end-binding protein Ku
MAARAIWKGILKIGSTDMPVKLYAAVQDRKVRFHVLQGQSKSRVKQQLVRDTGKAVAREDIRKGYEVEPGQFVVLEDAELERLKPEESRHITATRFVPLSEISNEWYERPYYLGPNGDAAEYIALVDALRKRDTGGIVRWSMRGKAYVGVLTTFENCLVLIKTRYSEEVLAGGLAAPESPPLDQKELRMAHELVAALAGEFKPEEFHDEYRERVLTFVEEKARGRHPRLPAVKTRKTGGSLDEQLERSLAALKRSQEKKIA